MTLCGRYRCCYDVAVDYIQEMLSEKQQLLVRLRRAQQSLPPDHPALSLVGTHQDSDGVALWEREWTGGTGVNDDDQSGGESDDE